MSETIPAVCPYPSCQHAYQATEGQTRCPSCTRSLDRRTVASAIARAANQARNGKREVTFNPIPSLKAKRGPKAAVVVPERLTGKEAATAACAAARRALHDEPDPLPWSPGEVRWDVDAG